MSQQDQISVVQAGQTGSTPSASAAVAAPTAAPTLRPPLPGWRSSWGRLAIPLFAVLAAFGFIALATLRWDAWVGAAVIQTTDDAYIRAETHPAEQPGRRRGSHRRRARISSTSRPAISWFRSIPPTTKPRSIRPRPASPPHRPRFDNLANQIELQYATIAQAEAQQVSAVAQEVETRQEQERQQSLDADRRRHPAKARAGHRRLCHARRPMSGPAVPLIAAQRHQLDVLSGNKKQRAADIAAAKATLAAARLKLGYTKIVAPFDGVVGERQVQPDDYVNIGTNLINVVPLPHVYVIANYKETQLTGSGRASLSMSRSTASRTSGCTAASSGSRPPADRNSHCCRPTTRPAISPRWFSAFRSGSSSTRASRCWSACCRGCRSSPEFIPTKRGRMAQSSDVDRGPVSRGGHRAATPVRGRRGAARLLSGQFRQPADLGRIAGPARRLLAELRRGRLALARPASARRFSSRPRWPGLPPCSACAACSAFRAWSMPWSR